MDKYIGRLLDNRYEILEEIGSGGMAVVYKARCHRLNRLVALKILKDDYLEDEDFRRRFHAESHAVAMLSHPNIVQVYDVFDSDEADYIVMELIDGISLKQYMEKKGVLNWKETLHFAIQIAKALEHAHSRGIVHRDIKPHNVMVLKNGSVKVTDFGIARMMSKGNTLTKEALGSVHYISPEQAKGGRVDNRSDIYSLGVVMYEMMSGRPPYDGESPVAIAIKHINGGAAMPSTLNPNIPGGLEQIIMKAMAHDVSDRYESASAMLHDLDEFRKDPAILFDYNTPMDELISIKKPPVADSSESKTPTMAEQAAAKAKKEDGGTSIDVSKLPQRRRPNQTSKKRANISTIAIISCSVVMLTAIIILMVVIFGGKGNNKKVSVPDLIGEIYSESMEYEGFVINKIDDVFDDEAPAGQIVYQEPKAGSEVANGTTIYIKVSKGKDDGTNTMLDVIGQKADDVEQVLKSMSLDLDVKIEEQSSDTYPEGQIIATDPVAGTQLTPGQIVTLYVSTGKDSKKMEMPNVLNLTLEKAKEILDLQEQELEYDTSETEYSDTVEKGRVVRTEPESGQPIVSGQTVKLIISLGMEPRVPEVEGKTVDDVKSAIKLIAPVEDIKFVEEEIPHGTVETGRVVKTSPETGASLVDVESVTIYVSTGPEKKKVPNVVGMTFEEAKKTLNDEGFTNVVRETKESDRTPNTVIEQNPAKQTEADVSAKITLTVAVAASKTTKAMTINNLTVSTERYTVIVTNKHNKQEVYYVVVEPGQVSVEVDVTGSGIQVYEISVNGEIIAEQDVNFSR